MADQTSSSQRTVDFGLLANFIHQVINPLNGVIGTIDNVIDGTIPSSKIEQRLKAARAQLEQSILLVRNLAFFSELGAGPRGTSRVKKVCVLPQVIIEAALFFQELGLQKGIAIHLTDRESQYKLEGNPDLLRQVFMNLFDNGVKYGSNGSKITVDPSIQRKTNSLLLRISGDSIPITADERIKIFELGYRSGSAKDHISSGTGLGLYICQAILSSVFNATIEVERSSSSGGTVFLIRFPTFAL